MYIYIYVSLPRFSLLTSDAVPHSKDVRKERALNLYLHVISGRDVAPSSFTHRSQSHFRVPNEWKAKPRNK